MGYVYLILAIIAEIVGTACLKSSEGFTKFWPSLISTIGYVTCTVLLSKSLQAAVPLNVVYATWCALGIIGATAIAVFVLHEKINFLGGVGIALVLVGVIMLNVYGPGH